jgi:hypothetical protein
MATETFLRFGALYRQENTFLGGAFRAGQEWGCFLLECAPSKSNAYGHREVTLPFAASSARMAKRPCGKRMSASRRTTDIGTQSYARRDCNCCSRGTNSVRPAFQLRQIPNSVHAA